MNFCVTFDKHLQFPGIFGTLMLFNCQTLSSFIQISFTFLLILGSVPHPHHTAKSFVLIDFRWSGRVIIYSSYPVWKKNALTAFGCAEHTVFRSHCVRGNELLRDRGIELNDMAGVKMYSMVFLLVLASKISFQGMSNCDTTKHSQHDHAHKG